MTNKEIVKQKIIEAVPEILELKFGCEIKIIFDIGNPLPIHKVLDRNDDRTIRTEQYGQLNEQDIKILGRPIRLADVLLAVAWVREAPVPLHDQRVLSVCSYWDMRNDSLEEQDGRTVGLIFNLLGEVAARAEKTDQA